MHRRPVGPAPGDQPGGPLLKFFNLIGLFQAPPEIALVPLVIKYSPEEMGSCSVLILDVAFEAKEL